MLAARNADNGYSASLTPTEASSSVVNSGVAPNSVMLASTGTPTASTNSGTVELIHGFRENHVGAGLDAGLGAIDSRSMPSTASASVRAMMTKAVVGARIDRGLDAVDHFLLADDGLVGTMTAALLHHLVLDMHAGDVGANHFAHAARDIEGAAPADVDVDQQRQGWRR